MGPKRTQLPPTHCHRKLQGDPTHLLGLGFPPAPVDRAVLGRCCQPRPAQALPPTQPSLNRQQAGNVASPRGLSRGCWAAQTKACSVPNSLALRLPPLLLLPPPLPPGPVMGALAAVFKKEVGERMRDMARQPQGQRLKQLKRAEQSCRAKQPRNQVGGGGCWRGLPCAGTQQAPVEVY